MAEIDKWSDALKIESFNLRSPAKKWFKIRRFGSWENVEDSSIYIVVYWCLYHT